MVFLVFTGVAVLFLVALALNRWGSPDHGGAVRDARAREMGRSAERFHDRHKNGIPPSNL